MPRRCTTKPQGLGKSIEADRKRRSEPTYGKPNKTGVADGQVARSVLEQSSLDEFCANAELGNQTFEAPRGYEFRFIPEGAKLVTPFNPESRVAATEKAAVREVPIPKRPAWTDDMEADELADLEGEAFLIWRRSLAQIEEQEGLIMTPYEKNLDFWRQLWRTVERSDLLVQIIDSRDPLFYRNGDLQSYVEETHGKRHLLLLNKADFLPADLRQQWASYLKGRGIEAIFFSALRELHRQSAISPDAVAEAAGINAAALAPHGPLNIDDPDVLDCTQLMDALRARLPAMPADAASASGGGCRGTVGFIGYPNVGKSSVINALFGAKKVSMSRIPGKTKHLQTLELPGSNITLCDCPGLVLPSVVATKGHLVINGTVPVDELRDHMPPMRLIVEKMGVTKACERYGVKASDIKEGVKLRGDDKSDETDLTRDLLAGFAASRKKFLKHGVPDETWAARRVLRDYCTGQLLHCEPPPSGPASNEAGARATASSAAVAPLPASEADPAATAAPLTSLGMAVEEAEDGSDFSDLDDFLGGGEKDKDAKKKEARRNQKQATKGSRKANLG